MKKTLIAIAFAAASIPMVFAQATTPANPPANGNAPAKTAKVHKHKKSVKKAAPKTETATPKQ
jgi:hypothetical protein